METSLNRRTFAATAAATGVGTCGLAAADQSATPVATPHTDVTARVLEYMERAGMPGCIYLVHEQGKDPEVTSLGVADLSSGAPMTPDLHMRIGSITKSFTATIILQLIDEGALAFDDVLADLVPETSPIPNAEVITIRHMLTMTSGIADYFGSAELSNIPDFGREEDLTIESIIPLITEQDAPFAPGEGAMYSNSNYWLLGVIAEKVTNETFANLVQNRIAIPLGLTNTLEPADMFLPAPAAHGYSFKPAQAEQATPAATPVVDPAATPQPLETARDVTEANLTLAGGAGSLVSTAADLDLFLTALKAGTLVTPELSAEQLRCEHDLDGLIYGMGVIELMGTRGHGGNIDGFASWACQDIETGTNYAVLCNLDPTRDGSPGHLAILSMISGKELPRRG